MVGFKLPPQNHPAREAMGDMKTLAAILDPMMADNLLTTRQALRKAREAFSQRGTGMRKVNLVVLRMDGERWLISVGPKGGWKKLWNFGTGRD